VENVDEEDRVIGNLKLRKRRKSRLDIRKMENSCEKVVEMGDIMREIRKASRIEIEELKIFDNSLSSVNIRRQLCLHFHKVELKIIQCSSNYLLSFLHFPQFFVVWLDSASFSQVTM
jgi:hypothetical protein